MTWPNFLSPMWGLMGLLAIPIVLLYLLRQKRPDMPVSSTLLWSKVLADMRASTPFQKLRRNLLLLLQLLILAALVFTLMRPVVQAQAGQNRAGVIVIDCTASMQTQDGGPNGQTRLERAKDEARKLVDGMRPGDRYMLLADGGGMRQIRSGFTTSKSELKQLIGTVKPSDTNSDLSESLLLAATSLKAIGGGNTEAVTPGAAAGAGKTESVVAGKVWLFSDGAGIRVPEVMGGGPAGAAPGGTGSILQFVKIGTSANSVGITRLAITPVPKEKNSYQVFVGLMNARPIERKVGVALAYAKKDNLLPGQAQFVTLKPGQQSGVVFDKVVSEPGRLYVQLVDADDEFPLDNTAYGLLEPSRKVKVMLVGSGKNAILERFLQTAAKVQDVEGQIIDASVYKPAMPADLVIFDGFTPDVYPKCDALIIRPGKSTGGFKVTAEIENPAITLVRREDPVMSYVELGELRVSKALLMEKDAEAVAVVSSPEAPLIAYKDFGAARRYFVAFSPLLESNWWMQPSLLIFLQNVVEQTRARHFIGMPQMLAAGRQPAKLWDVGEKVTIAEPDGTEVILEGKDGAADFPGTDQAGFYTVESNGKKGEIAVNLLSPVESNIAPKSLQETAGGNVEESTGVATVNKEIWSWLALAALAILMVEWLVYHRRIA